ncbi:MAG: class I SAM-dependent methyltransferase [Chthoniobacterales bacterium]|jgi:SAM-dependent methyltransferase
MDIPLGEDQLIDLSAVSDIFHAMQEVTVGSFPLSDVVGGGDPQYVAQEIVRAIRAHGLLTSPRSIIDIGCGCGRIATALTQVLPAEAQYIGVDIVPALINFARERITPRFPHFRFVLLDESNAFYDYYRQAADAGHVSESTIRALDEAAPRNSIDMALSVSLFTHLDYPAAADLLSRLHRIMEPGGEAFITVFLVDEHARRTIKQGTTAFSFGHLSPSGKLLVDRPDEPTFAAAYEVPVLYELLKQTGFSLERIARGYWADRSTGHTYQDVAIISKGAD